MITEQNNPEAQNTAENGVTALNTAQQSNIETAAVSTLGDVKDNDILEDTPEPKFYTWSVRLRPHENKYLMDILEGRQNMLNKGVPLTMDKNHLLRQFIRFTTNHRKGMFFIIPEGIPETIINT